MQIWISRVEPCTRYSYSACIGRIGSAIDHSICRKEYSASATHIDSSASACCEGPFCHFGYQLYLYIIECIVTGKKGTASFEIACFFNCYKSCILAKLDILKGEQSIYISRCRHATCCYSSSAD